MTVRQIRGWLFWPAVFCLLTVLVYPRAAEFLVKRYLGALLPNSRVDAGSVRFNPFGSIRVSDLNVTGEGDKYRLMVKEAILRYSLFSLFKEGIREVRLNGIDCSVVSLRYNCVQLPVMLGIKPGKSSLPLRVLNISDAVFDLKLKNLLARGALTLSADLCTGEINEISLALERIESGGIEADDLSVYSKADHPEGSLEIGLVKYAKFKVSRLNGALRLGSGLADIKISSAGLLGGDLSGRVKVNYRDGFKCFCVVKVSGIDLLDFINALDLDEKVMINGKVSGDMTISSDGADIETLKGDFFAGLPGGSVTVKDRTFLNNMAESSGQSLQFLAESLSDYRYDTAEADLRLFGKDLLLDVTFNGNAGRRSFKADFHDFNSLILKEVLG